MRTLLLVGAIFLMANAAYAQSDWTAVAALPSSTLVHVDELGGRGGHVEGRIQSVE